MVAQQRPSGGVKFPVNTVVGTGVVDHLGQLDRGDTFGDLVAERISRPADDRVAAQVRGQNAQPRPRGPGRGPGAGDAAQARDVERALRGQDRLRVKRVLPADRVGGVQRHRAEHLRVPRGEHLPEEGPIGIAVEIDPAGPQPAQQQRHVPGRVRCRVQVAGLHVPTARQLAGVVQLPAALAGVDRVGGDAVGGLPALQWLAEERRGIPGAAQVDQEQVAPGQQRAERPPVVRRVVSGGEAGATLDREDRSHGRAAGRRVPLEPELDMARCRVPVIQRHTDPGAPGQARDPARRDRHRADPDRVTLRRGARQRRGSGLGRGRRAAARLRRRGARESLAAAEDGHGHRARGRLANEPCQERHMRHAHKISPGPGSGKAEHWSTTEHVVTLLTGPGKVRHCPSEGRPPGRR